MKSNNNNENDNNNGNNNSNENKVNMKNESNHIIDIEPVIIIVMAEIK